MKIGNPVDIIRSGPTASGTSALDANANATTNTNADKGKVSALSSAPAKLDSSSTVQLSGGLASLKSELVDTNAFNAKRVEELKAAIAQGTFKVNPEAVADKLISGNLDALARSKT